MVSVQEIYQKSTEYAWFFSAWNAHEERQKPSPDLGLNQNPFWAPTKLVYRNKLVPGATVEWNVEWPLGANEYFATKMGVLAASSGDYSPEKVTNRLWLLALHDLNDGHLIWSRPYSYPSSWKPVTCLGIVGETVIVDAIDHICCLSIATGVCLWKRPVVGHHSSTMVSNARTNEQVIAVRLLPDLAGGFICLSSSDGRTTFGARLTGPVESFYHGPLLWVDGDKMVTMEGYRTPEPGGWPATRVMVYSLP